MGMHLLTLVALHPCSSLVVVAVEVEEGGRGGGAGVKGGGGGGGVVVAAAKSERMRGGECSGSSQVATAFASFQWIKIIRFSPGRRVANDLGVKAVLPARTFSARHLLSSCTASTFLSILITSVSSCDSSESFRS